MKQFIGLLLIAAMLLLAACDVPVMTLTPSSPVTLTTTIPTSTPSATEIAYPILLTVVPRAVRSINVREAICLALYTQYQLWPYKLEIIFDEAEYQQCLEGRPH